MMMMINLMSYLIQVCLTVENVGSPEKPRLVKKLVSLCRPAQRGQALFYLLVKVKNVFVNASLPWVAIGSVCYIWSEMLNF